MLQIFYSKTCGKVQEPTCNCEYSDGLYTVSINTKEQLPGLYFLCTCLAGHCFLTVLFLQVTLIFTISNTLYPQTNLFAVIMVVMFACNILLCCFGHARMLNSNTSCEQIIKELKRQRTELLTSSDGIIQPLNTSLYHQEDQSFLKVCQRQNDIMKKSFTSLLKFV